MFFKNISRFALTTLSAATLASLTACGGGSAGSNDSPAMGRLTIGVTDAPIDEALAVVIEFTGISIKPAQGEALDFEFDEPMSIDLLTLQGMNSVNLIQNESVPAGEYEWIRLHVNAEEDSVMDSYIETESEGQLELRAPSGSQTGLKLVNGFTVFTGGISNFTIDFDLRKSIVFRGNSGRSPMLKPVLRLIDNGEAGAIAGTLDPLLINSACADPATEIGAVYLYLGADKTPMDVSGIASDPLTTALVAYENDAYSYEFGFLAPGAYTLAYTCDAAADDPELPDELNFYGTGNVSVESNSTATFDFAAPEVVAPEEESSTEEVSQ